MNIITKDNPIICRTTVKEYIVEYKQAGDGINITVDSVTNRKHKTLKNLKTYTKYTIWVYSIDYIGSRSHPAETVATTLGGGKILS